MSKFLFWIGALFAIGQVAWPTIQEKMREYREKFPKEPEYDGPLDYSEPVPAQSGYAVSGGVTPVGVQSSGTGMSPDGKFE